MRHYWFKVAIVLLTIVRTIVRKLIDIGSSVFEIITVILGRLAFC